MVLYFIMRRLATSAEIAQAATRTYWMTKRGNSGSWRRDSEYWRNEIPMGTMSGKEKKVMRGQMYSICET